MVYLYTQIIIMESNQFCLNFVEIFNNLKMFNVQNTFSIKKVLTDVRSLATCRESSEAFTLIHQIVLNVIQQKFVFSASSPCTRVFVCPCCVYILLCSCKAYFSN